jgi:hypothetical protein
LDDELLLRLTFAGFDRSNCFGLRCTFWRSDAGFTRMLFGLKLRVATAARLELIFILTLLFQPERRKYISV